MNRAIVIREYGGPEKLKFELYETLPPGPGEVTVRHTAIGVNYHDVYVRSGLYRTLALPGVPGVEAVGVVERVGPGVADVVVGDRVVYITATYGAYTETSTVPVDQVMRFARRIDDCTAAAVVLKGMTALMLLTKLRPVRAGEFCMVHAAAGGVGRLLAQWAAHLGLHVLGTVGDETKIAIARRNGCAEVLLHSQGDLVEQTMRFTDGRGMDIVYDAIGHDTFDRSMKALAFGGLLVNYGQSSGSVDPIAPAELAQKSNGLWRPILFHYLRNPVDRQEMLNRVLDAVDSEVLKPEIAAMIPLKDAEAAHHLIESRRANGSILLIP